MKSMKIKMLQFDTRWPLSVNFIMETTRDGKNLSTFYSKSSLRSIHRKK